MTLVRWLIALALSFAVATPVDAGVFKARGKDPAKPTAKAAKKAPAKAAPAPKKAAAKKSPVKKGRTSAVASNGRPDDLTPDPDLPKSKKGKSGDVVITEDTAEKDDDVIIRDLDD